MTGCAFNSHAKWRSPGGRTLNTRDNTRQSSRQKGFSLRNGRRIVPSPNFIVVVVCHYVSPQQCVARPGRCLFSLSNQSEEPPRSVHAADESFWDRAIVATLPLFVFVGLDGLCRRKRNNVGRFFCLSSIKNDIVLQVTLRVM